MAPVSKPPVSSAMAAYRELCHAFGRAGLLEHTSRQLMWDTMVKLPPGGHASRTAVTQELAIAQRAAVVSPRMPQLFAQAGAPDVESAIRRLREAASLAAPPATAVAAPLFAEGYAAPPAENAAPSGITAATSETPILRAVQPAAAVCVLGSWGALAPPDPATGGPLAAEGLSLAQRGNLLEMRRRYEAARRVDPALVARKEAAAAEAQRAWAAARPRNDFGAFLPHLDAVVQIAREEGRQLAVDTEVDGPARLDPAAPYDALLGQYEPGAKAAALETIFADLSEWLPAAIEHVVRVRQPAEDVAAGGPPLPLHPTGPRHAAAGAAPASEAVLFPVERQQALGRRIMETMGLDMRRARLDVSAHPFCGGVPSDVRMTGRFDVRDPLSGVLAVVHEAGHALYEQHLPAALDAAPSGPGALSVMHRCHLPGAAARGMGVHESQSLLAEMQLARGDAFAEWLAGAMRDALVAPLLEGPTAVAEAEGQHLVAAFAPTNVGRLMRRVAPGKIRVDADELCYPLHVALRFDIERALVAGDLRPADVPRRWDELMRRHFGISTEGDDRDGCLQDVHWPIGAFGYFPTYTLGAMYAAQMAAALRRDIDAAAATGGAPGTVDELLRRGEHTPLCAWRHQRVWGRGSTVPVRELLVGATGEPLNAAHFKAHLMQRYVL